MSASPRRHLRTHTNVVAVAAALVLVLAGVQSASAGPHRVRLTGTYRAMAVDGMGWGRTDHYLISGGATYLMQRGGDFPELASGSRVEVDGTLDGAKLHASTVQAAPVAAPTAPAHTTARLATDTRKVLAILVNWTAPDSVTPVSAVNQLEDMNDSWYDDASYGQVRMTADATEWLTIPAPSACDSSGIMSNALTAASGAGWNLNAYDHLLVYFPYLGSCGYAGMAYIGFGELWINGYMDTRVTVHELGHNLGLYHAHAVTCTQLGTAVPWSDTCTRGEYDDPVDAMGGSFWGGVGRFNASQCDELGWLQGRKQDGMPAGGTYDIAPLGKQAEGLQALRLPGSAHDIWIEYRRATGIDSWLPSGITGGVLLHIPAAVGGSDILDMTPGDGTFTNAALLPGQTWIDPVTDWAIHVNSIGAAAATVTVGKSPDTTAPTFTSMPRLSFAAPQQLPRRGKPARVHVSWTAKDPGGAVTGYDVRVATDGGGWTTLATDDAVPSSTVDAAPGHTYAVQVRATDGWGNKSGWADAPPISLSTLGEKRLTYEGRWSTHHDRHALGNTYRVTRQAKASAVLHVKAKAVAMLARVGPKYGSVRVFVDGHRKRSFSQKASGNGYRQVTFRIAWPQAGAHTIRFVNVGTHGHPSFSIDGIAVLT